MKPKPAFSWDDVDAVLRRSAPPKIPDGAFTVRDYSSRSGFSMSHSTRILTLAVKDGKLQRARANGSSEFYYWIER